MKKTHLEQAWKQRSNQDRAKITFKEALVFEHPRDDHPTRNMLMSGPRHGGLPHVMSNHKIRANASCEENVRVVKKIGNQS